MVEDPVQHAHERRVLLEQTHSRLPVYDGTIDNVVGYVTAREILSLALEKEVIALGELLRPVKVFPETVLAIDVLRFRLHYATRVFGDLRLGHRIISELFRQQDGQPPGTVFIGLALPGVDTEAHQLKLPGDRERVRQFAAISGLDLNQTEPTVYPHIIVPAIHKTLAPGGRRARVLPYTGSSLRALLPLLRATEAEPRPRAAIAG